jgi:DNA topoisomerase-1
LEDEGILVEKARWGRSVITKGKIKIELSKDRCNKLTLEEVQEMIAKKHHQKGCVKAHLLKKLPPQRNRQQKQLLKSKVNRPYLAFFRIV